jgi:biopolymer transport protein ExbD
MANKIKKDPPELEELDLTVFMSLMVVLIPILLASAEFAKIATIDISLPKGRGSQVQQQQQKKSEEQVEDDKLILTAMLTDSALTLGAKSGFMPSIFYKEFHKYVSKDDGTTLDRVEYFPDKLDRKTGEYPAEFMPENPVTGKKYTIHEREEIYLIAYETDNNNQFTKPIQGLYSNEFSELITNKGGRALSVVNAGDVVYALTTRMSPVSEEQIEKLKVGEEIEARRPVKITDPSAYTLKDLSAYDAIKSLLVQIRERYPDAEDRDDLIIAAENQIVYDKIIQIMDAARSANLPNISIAKFRM